MSISTATEFRKKLKKRPSHFWIIHYSCQSLYDNNEGLSPRITSIACLLPANGQTVSFSTHAIAEELHIPIQEVTARFDEIETTLLRRFYEFILEHRDKYWIHWNMRNITYGFEHIEHRARSLGINNIPSIPIEQRVNLNDMLSEWYGSGYADDPKMKSLMVLNGGLHRHFLDGLQEIQAFRDQEYIKMHNSTLCKVGFFARVIEKWKIGSLDTKTGAIWPIIEKVYDSATVKVLTMIGTAASIISVPLSIFLLLI